MFEVARIYRTDNGSSLKAFVDIIYNGQLLIKGLRVIVGKSDNLFVTMPKAQGKDGKWYDTVKLLDDAAKDEVSDVVLEAYRV